MSPEDEVRRDLQGTPKGIAGGLDGTSIKRAP